MKCIKCGFTFDEGLFCPECGTKYDAEEEKKRIEEMKRQYEREEQEKQRIYQKEEQERELKRQEEREKRELEKAKAKVEQERLAKERVEREAEVLRLRKEEAERKAEEERKAKEEQREKEDRLSRTFNGIEYQTKEEMEAVKRSFEAKKAEEEQQKSQQKKVDSYAVWSLICGIATWILSIVLIGVFFVIPSVVFGVKALKNKTTKKGFAIAGIASVSIYIMIGILGMVIGLVSYMQ